MEILLFIIEFVEHYLEISPRRTVALKESEHTT